MPDYYRAPSRFAIFGIALVVAAGIPGLLSLRVETDMTGSWMTPLTPSSQRYIEYLDRFPPDNGALVVVTGGFETGDRWDALAALTDDLAALDVVDRVESLTTAEYVRGDDESVDVVDVLDLTDDPSVELSEVVRKYPPFQHLLISPDGFAAGVYVRAAPDATPQTFSPAVQSVIDAHLSMITKVEGGDIFQTGEMRVNAEFARLTVRSTSLIAISVMVMFGVVVILSRSFSVGVLAGMTGALTAIVIFAFMGYADITLTPFNSLVACMFVPLGAASVLHADAYARHPGRRVLWDCVPAVSIKPFVFATATTMIAFGATAINGYADVQQFGLLGALGIGVSLLIVNVAVFPLLRRRPLVESDEGAERDVFQFVTRVPKPVAVLVLLVLVGLSAVGIARIEYSFGPSDYYRSNNQVLRDFNLAGEYFGRYPAPFTVFRERDDAALDIDLWGRLHTFVDTIESEFPGTHAAWPYESLSQLSLAYTADEASPRDFPDSSDLLAQYLVLFDEQELESYLDWDRVALTVMFQMPFRNSAEYRVFRDRVETLASELGIDGGLTGRIPVFFDAGDKVTAENLESIVIGGIAIFVLLLIILRSATVSVIAIAVNFLPVAGTLAFFGLFGVELDIPMSFGAAIALGLVVDDTGHMVARYDVLRRAGILAEDAARTMVNEYWRPVLFTSLTVVIGFAVMMFAPLKTYHSFSWMICFTMTYALLGDLLFLPVLLTHFDRRRFNV